MQREIEEQRRRKRGIDAQLLGEDGPPSMVDSNPLETFQRLLSKNQEPKIERQEDLVECKLCHKTIIAKTRGLHILLHAKNDLNIIRFCCKFCDFKHERSQSVATHGKNNHGTEDCVDDSLNQYEEEIKSLWKACFGQEQLFQGESRKRRPVSQLLLLSQILILQLKPNDSVDDSTVEHVDPDKSTYQSETPSSQRMFSPSNNSSPVKKSQGSASTPTTGSGGGGNSGTKKKASTRRFGIRKPKSRKQRAEMAKLREVSMRIGGAMYFKKRSSDSVLCEVKELNVCYGLIDSLFFRNAILT
jgi:hypothetical protein